MDFGASRPYETSFLSMKLGEENIRACFQFSVSGLGQSSFGRTEVITIGLVNEVYDAEVFRVAEEQRLAEEAAAAEEAERLA
jgi:enoyl-CoA hydratase/carnithine racemase